VAYMASNGRSTIVAQYEHTVIVIGYSADYVTLLDGNLVYIRSVDQFLQSWGVLGNMAVMVEP
jgi:predicted double-glycine peptidase